MQFLLPALLFAPVTLAIPAAPYPLPWQAGPPPPPSQAPQQPQEKPEPLTAYDVLLPIVNDRIKKPKEWIDNPAAEGQIDVSDEDLEFLAPKNNIKFSDDTTLQEWLSPLGKNFKKFMGSMKDQNERSRLEAEAEESVSNLEKRTIPSMFNKNKKPAPAPEPEPEPQPQPQPSPEQKQAEEELDNLELNEVEITNEEFDHLFSEYASRYERATGFQGLQGHLDNILLPGNIGYDSNSKPWKQRQYQQQPSGPRLARRGGSNGGSSSNTTPSYLWTPESEKIGVKPVSSINPEIFNRIAAEYRFGQDPTSINREEGAVGGSGANNGAAGGQQAKGGSGGKKGKMY